jgi:hypothetical protein
VNVITVEPARQQTPGGSLYDLNLAITTGVRQEFWAGKGGQFYLVAPEFPVVDQAGAAAVAIVATMEGLVAAGGSNLSNWPSSLPDLVHQFAAAIFDAGLDHALHAVPSFGSPAPQEPLFERIGKLYQALHPVDPAGANSLAALFDGFMSTIVPWLTASVAMGWRQPPENSGDVAVVTVFDMALTPESPIPAESLIRMEVSVKGQSESVSSSMWNRGGRANTRFHHYFDQLLHLESSKIVSMADLEFAVTINGAPIPSLLGAAPLVVGEGGHRFQSAQLLDAAGTVIGSIRFDSRLLTQAMAQHELTQSGLWTEVAAEAYANAIGKAMVEPILTTLDALAGVKR